MYEEEYEISDDPRIAIALVVGAVLIVLAVIAALFVEEVLDRSTERACVEKNTKTDDDDYCDL